MGQTFRPDDLASVAVLVALEAMLSADNAVVLAIMVRHLPQRLQRHALLYGMVGAFGFRILAILFAYVVLRQWWLQAIGAAYLLFLPFKHFRFERAGEAPAKPANRSFWLTVATVEITDLAFAVDSVLAGVTFVDNRRSKLWIVVFGAVIGIVLLRFAASALVGLLSRYPALDHVAYLLVGWVGVKLAFLSGHTFTRHNPDVLAFAIPELSHFVFWSVLLAVGGVGAWLAVRHSARESGPLPPPPQNGAAG